MPLREALSIPPAPKLHRLSQVDLEVTLQLHVVMDPVETNLRIFEVISKCSHFFNPMLQQLQYTEELHIQSFVCPHSVTLHQLIGTRQCNMSPLQWMSTAKEQPAVHRATNQWIGKVKDLGQKLVPESKPRC